MKKKKVLTKKKNWEVEEKLHFSEVISITYIVF